MTYTLRCTCTLQAERRDRDVNIYPELDVDVFLHWHGNAREERAVPLELGEELTTQLANRHDVTAARLDVDLLVVLEILAEPVPEISRWLRVSAADEHKAQVNTTL